MAVCRRGVLLLPKSFMGIKHGEGVEMDLVMIAHSFKPVADHGFAHGSLGYGLYLEQGEGVAMEMIGIPRHRSNLLLIRKIPWLNSIIQAGTVHDYKPSADQEFFAAPKPYGLCDEKDPSVDFTRTVPFLKLKGDQNHRWTPNGVGG
jgi:hypothetical protein